MTDIKKGSNDKANGMKDRSNFGRSDALRDSKNKSGSSSSSEKEWSRSSNKSQDDVEE